MSLDRVKSLLSDKGFAPENVVAMSAAAWEWFTLSPSVESFATYSMLDQLARLWDDNQGVPTEGHVLFDQELRPVLARLLADPTGQLESLVRTYHHCCKSTAKLIARGLTQTPAPTSQSTPRTRTPDTTPPPGSLPSR